MSVTPAARRAASSVDQPSSSASLGVDAGEPGAPGLLPGALAEVFRRRLRQRRSSAPMRNRPSSCHPGAAAAVSSEPQTDAGQQPADQLVRERGRAAVGPVRPRRRSTADERSGHRSPAAVRAVSPSPAEAAVPSGPTQASSRPASLQRRFETGPLGPPSSGTRRRSPPGATGERPAGPAGPRRSRGCAAAARAALAARAQLGQLGAQPASARPPASPLLRLQRRPAPRRVRAAAEPPRCGRVRAGSAPASGLGPPGEFVEQALGSAGRSRTGRRSTPDRRTRRVSRPGAVGALPRCSALSSARRSSSPSASAMQPRARSSVRRHLRGGHLLSPGHGRSRRSLTARQRRAARSLRGLARPGGRTTRSACCALQYAGRRRRLAAHGGDSLQGPVGGLGTRASGAEPLGRPWPVRPRPARRRPRPRSASRAVRSASSWRPGPARGRAHLRAGPRRLVPGPQTAPPSSSPPPGPRPRPRRPRPRSPARRRVSSARSLSYRECCSLRGAGPCGGRRPGRSGGSGRGTRRRAVRRAAIAASWSCSSSRERKASATSATTAWSIGGRASVSAWESAFSLGRLDSCGWRSWISRSTRAA